MRNVTPEQLRTYIYLEKYEFDEIIGDLGYWYEADNGELVFFDEEDEMVGFDTVIEKLSDYYDSNVFNIIRADDCFDYSFMIAYSE